MVHFFQGTSVSITFYLFEHYQLWMMEGKAQRVFFANIPKLCSTLKSAPVIILSLVLKASAKCININVRCLSVKIDVVKAHSDKGL